MTDTDDTTEQMLTPTQMGGGAAGAAVTLTPENDTRRIHLKVPPKKVVPIIFLPGIMGSNLRISRKRLEELKKEGVSLKDNRGWRPDDIGNTIGRRSDSAKIRQMLFDPDETEVEVYNWTSDGNKFDVESAQDKRHENVPDNLEDIPPLLCSDKQPTELNGQENISAMTAAQKARWRGWSEILMDAYREGLMQLEARLNNVKTTTGAIDPFWLRISRKVTGDFAKA